MAGFFFARYRLCYGVQLYRNELTNLRRPSVRYLLS